MDLSAYKPLSKQEGALKLLCFYAYLGEAMSQSDRETYAYKENVSLESITVTEKKLSRDNYLGNSFFNWYNYDYTYQIKIKHYIPVLYLLYTEHPDWVKNFKSYASTGDSPYNELCTMLQLAIKGQTDKISSAWFGLECIPFLMPVATDPCLGKIALRMPQHLFYAYFDSALAYLSENDMVDEDNMLQSLLHSYPAMAPEKLAELKEALALYRYYSHGEYTPAQNPKTLFALLLEAVHAAHHKEYDKAIGYFEAALKIRNKTATEKNIFAGMLNAYFFVMTYVHEGSAGSITKLQQFLRKKSTLTLPTLVPAYTMASCFTNIERKYSQVFLTQLLRDDSGKTAQHFGFLFTRYFQAADDNLLKTNEFLPAQAVMKHELSAFLPLTDKERQKLKACFGEAPLLSSIRTKQPWELILENLLEEEESKTMNVKPEKSLRLGYFIRSDKFIEVREQSILKSGQWGSGKVVASNRYQTGDISCMDEVDKKIWARWRKNRSYNMYIEDALPELVGTDRLYTGRHAPFEPVTVTQEKPYLMIEKAKDCFTVNSNYPPLRAAGRYDCTDCIVVKKNPTHFVVVPLEGRQRRYYEQLLALGRFPLEAEKALKEFFPKVDRLIEVHSSLIKGGSTLSMLDGTSALCLQVQPKDGDFHVRLYAKPLPDGKALFTPGEGLPIVVDEKDGTRYQVKRHLARERDNYEAMVEFIEDTLSKAVFADGTILPADSMPALLDHVRLLPENYFVEWPEGEKIRLKKPSAAGNWNISLNSNRNWFDVEGDVQLDDETVMSIAQLLELMGQSRGKYIRLNDTDYLRLSDDLRKQLDRLESFTVMNHGKMQISNFHAGLLTDDMLNGEVTIRHDAKLDQMRQQIADSRNLHPKVPAKLKATLRDYQLDGFQWMARLNSWGAGACLADDMGLGKTVQTIAYLLLKAKEGASLVIAPASVVPNWRKELQRFAPALNVIVLNESDNRQEAIEKAKKFDVVLSTYGLLVSEADALAGWEWNVICLDEAHTIKNRETKTSAAAMKLQSKNKLILTGTPIQNHLGELWNLFQFINPGLLGSYEQFNQKYIIPIGQNKDKQRQLQLNRIVHPFMLRRTKQEVVEELPDKEEIILPVELTEEELAIYETIRHKAKAMLGQKGASVSVSVLSEITRLRQAACCASLAEKKWQGGCSKIDMLMDLMNELKARGNRALIFSQFTSFLELVKQSLDRSGEEYLYLDGSVPMKQREKLVNDFQHGDCPFFLISLKAGGLGLNLTGANYIIHLDPWWNPAIEQQATDRAYRIGQSQKVTAYHLIASHTIEEKIMRLHETKRNIADALLEGTDISHKLTAKELLAMLDGEEAVQK